MCVQVSAVLCIFSHFSFSTTSTSSKVSTPDGEPADEYQVWGEMLANWEDTKRRRLQKLKLMVRQGIPPAVRGLAWQLLAEAKDLPLPENYVDLLEVTDSLVLFGR